MHQMQYNNRLYTMIRTVSHRTTYLMAHLSYKVMRLLNAPKCPCLSQSNTRMSQAAENLTVRGTAACSRPFAADVIATCTASGDVPFATGDATATGTISTIVTAVVSTVATTAVATDKQT
jgi:hypothetical protein